MGVYSEAKKEYAKYTGEQDKWFVCCQDEENDEEKDEEINKEQKEGKDMTWNTHKDKKKAREEYKSYN